MTAPEAKAKLEAWADLLKAKLEGVTPGPWFHESWRGTSLVTGGPDAMDQMKISVGHDWDDNIEKWPLNRKNGIFVAMSRPAISAMLAGIEAVLNAKVKDQADLPVMEERSVVVYPRAGKTLRAAITVAEASILIAMAEAYEPYFQAVQS